MIKPFYTLTDQDQLELVVKSKNRPGSQVYREDLPSVLFNRAPRVLLGKKWFDSYSKSNTSIVCESCLAKGSLERHEVYSLYKWKGAYVIKLEYILKLCSKCHKKVHGGFSSKLGMKYGFLPEVIPVSDATDSKKYPWNKAKFLLVDNNLYKL